MNLITSSMSAERKAEVKKESIAKLKMINKGKPPKTGIESAAFFAFSLFINLLCPEETKHYEFLPVQDGLYADIMIRKDAWPKDMWKMIQVKSLQVHHGKSSHYNVGGYRADIYMLCIGIIDYARKLNRLHADDVDTCQIAEIYFMGNNNGLKYFYPTFGLQSKKEKMLKYKHIMIGHTSIEEQKLYVKEFFADLENPNFVFKTKDQINGGDFVYVNQNHKGVFGNIQVEKEGILATLLTTRLHGFIDRPPKCQQETTDVILSHPELKKNICNISFKTVSFNHGRSNQFQIDKGKHCHHYIVDIVIAVHVDRKNKVYNAISIIDANRVYENAKKNILLVNNNKCRHFDNINIYTCD